jgi:hypothetical protein
VIVVMNLPAQKLLLIFLVAELLLASQKTQLHGVIGLVVVHITHVTGRAIAQAVSRWLPTAAARVRARVWSCGFCAGQSGAGAGFLRVLRFLLPIFIPPFAPQS